MHNYTNIKYTERLIIRPLDLNDVDDWARFLEDERATKYYPDLMKVDTDNLADKWIRKAQDRYAEGSFGLMALIEKSTGNFVGQCGLLMQHIDEKDEIEIGYHLLPTYWGKGFATEAARKFKHLAFMEYNFSQLISIIMTDNIPSQKVAERNGMSRYKKSEYKGSEVYIFRITKNEWENDNEI